jgi:hypothetical protein
MIGILYGKFNNHDKHAAILKGSNKGVTVLDRPLRKLAIKKIEKQATINSLYEEEFIWGNIFPKRRF